MIIAALIFLFAGVTALILTPIIRRCANHLELLDQALSSRKVHAVPVPRLGGIAIVFAFNAAVGVALLWPSVTSALSNDPAESPAKAAALLLGGLAIFALGLWDDLVGTGARQKFAVQFAVALALYAVGFRIEVVDNPFGGDISLGPFGLPITVLWIAGVTNAMNLIDGLDGLAGGLAIAAAAMMFAAGGHGGHLFAMIVAAALAGSVVGFLPYNFSPATIYMGDTGSMFIGYVLAASAIQATHPNGGVMLIAAIVALGIPIADTLSAMVRRAVRGAPLFAADREHIHHRLLDLGLTQRQVSLILWSAAAMLAGAGMTLAGCGRGTLLIALAVSFALALNQLGVLRIDNVSALLRRRRKNLARRRAIAELRERLRGVTSLGQLAASLQPVAEMLGARCIWVKVGSHPDDHGPLLRYGPVLDPASVFLTRHSLLGDRQGVSGVEVGWPGLTSVDRDTEIALELVCQQVAVALRRIQPWAVRTPVRALLRWSSVPAAVSPKLTAGPPHVRVE